MNKQKQFIGTLILSLGLISTTAVTYITSVSAQSNSEISSIKTKSGLSSIAFQKLEAWHELGMKDIQGNNLDPSSHEVTSGTTELDISKTTLYFSTKVQIYSKQGVIAETNINTSGNLAGVGVIHVPRGTFQKNQKYTVVFMNESSHVRVVADFTVSSSEWEEHNPPTLTAYNRTVTKDDPTFNIMDGVSAHDDEGNDITQNITHTGNVDIHRVGDYHITYWVTDKNGLSSSQPVVISVKDNTPSLPKPMLDEMTDSDTTITGTGTPNTDIYVILGTSFNTYREKVKANGTFIISLEHPYPAGTGIQAYTQDSQGNKSETYYGVVQTGDITVGVNQILSADTFVSGYTSPGANIEVAVNNSREHLFTGKADYSGKYNIGMQGLSYPAGTSVRVTASLNNHSSSKTVIVYPKRVSIDTAKSGDSIILGEADPNATVHLYVHGKNYQFKVDAAGNFRGNIDLPLVNGDRITAYQVSNDIESEPVTVYVASK